MTALLAYEKDLSVLEANYQSPLRQVRSDVARNPATPSYMLKAIILIEEALNNPEDNDEVVWFVAANPSADAALLTYLFEKKTSVIYDALEANPSTPVGILTYFASDLSNRSRCLGVAANPSVPATILYDLAISYAAVVATNPACPQGLLRILSHSSERAVLKAVMNNANTDNKVKAALRHAEKSGDTRSQSPLWN